LTKQVLHALHIPMMPCSDLRWDQNNYSDESEDFTHSISRHGWSCRKPDTGQCTNNERMTDQL